ncbi:enoyl-CoA hydratase/isomerase family protein [Mycolicibacterium sp. CBMA 226]|uniref:enoyl-CoA hydratase/isomerase family protein n=1 Tax=Mycolicibacterium sp. CBMA 226 TaxID=2606611 RepID=UPI0012DD34C3|nr:enoyl-CoA hydratase-related protein [Mycolicibacterium sp. CBMA 226]MUL74507.1 enoyl-CoA hydratase/isomerase family protein [Mycolicibacterium sp. CBMA 226]
MGRQYETLRVEQRGDVLIVTISHPGNHYNFVDLTLMEEMAELMSGLRSQEDARAVLLTGTGRYFSAGGSFDLMAELHRPEVADRTTRAARRLISDLLAVPAPIVCAMNGPAIGFGATWVLLSDVVFAGSDVSMSDPHVLRGVAAPDGPALWSLAMGPIRAKRFLLTGEELSATQAAELGLITFVTDPGGAFDEALAFAQKLAAGAPSAIAHTKLLCNIHVRAALDMSFDTGAAWECQDFRTADHREAIASFRERRAPAFTGS